MDIKENLMDTLLQLAAIPGVSGTVEEKLVAGKIYELLYQIPYFKNNPEKLQMINIKDDPYQRAFVSALFCSSKPARKTVVITGHFDVVGVEEFGHLKELAFSPLEYTKRVSELKLDEDSLIDLKSGNWLFGRGVADMKYGISLGIELMRQLSQTDDFEGNILFLAVPGEETNSEGMLGAVPHLVYLQETMGYEFTGLLLPEPYLFEDPTDKTRYIHIGACGKIMPVFFAVGKETHVSEPFNGLNPNLIISELTRLMELNTDLCSKKGENTTPPPTCLKQMDLKDLYSVQTPLYAASYYNLITLDINPSDLIANLKKICLEAFNNAINLVNAKHKKIEIKKNDKLNLPEIKPNVLTYEELYNEVKFLFGEEFDVLLSLKIKVWLQEKLDIQTIAVNIVKETYEYYPNKCPMIVIGFAPPYYPDRYPGASSQSTESFFETIDDVIEYACNRYGEEMVRKDYYMGICDLSYTGLNPEVDIYKVASNMLGLGHTYVFPTEEISKLDIPGIVLGAYGKDMHKYTERLHMPYALDILPDLYRHFIYKLFSR